ncbi:MAG: nucleoside-diphosphate kinase [Acholeplasmataceae bacterium]|jgi:nucleoside-diphosphate kinase|nr:nucleoside-diphosphate kinase [Acholeplasmataceae bacterium]
MQHSTFIMLKPDAIERHLTQDILKIFKDQGYEITRQSDVIVDEPLILKHYESVIAKVNQAWFEKAIIDMFVGHHVYIYEITKKTKHIIEEVRELVGATDPIKADKNSIRGRYMDDSLEKALLEKRFLRNIIHASDSIESAQKEMKLWFK